MVATLGEVTPSIVVILIVAAMLKKFRDSRYVNNAFYGLRPASTGLIGAACVAVVLEVLTHVVSPGTSEGGIVNRYALDGEPLQRAGVGAGGGAAGADQLGETHKELTSHRVHRPLRRGGCGIPLCRGVNAAVPTETVRIHGGIFRLHNP